MVNSLYFMRCFSFLLLLAVVVSASSPLLHAEAPNIIFITVDTTRADRMGFLGSKLGSTASGRSRPPRGGL